MTTHERPFGRYFEDFVEGDVYKAARHPRPRSRACCTASSGAVGEDGESRRASDDPKDRHPLRGADGLTREAAGPRSASRRTAEPAGRSSGWSTNTPPLTRPVQRRG